MHKAHAKEYEKCLKVFYPGNYWRCKASLTLILDCVPSVERGSSFRPESGWYCGSVREHTFEYSGGYSSDLWRPFRLRFAQGIANSHLETEKNIKGSVLPILERLHVEIKNKSKELSKGAVKGAKEVDKARNTTQKYIELLGQHTASFSSSGGRVEPSNDPYILQRGVRHRLNKQVLEENNIRHDLLAVQDSFQQFEGHIIQTFQKAMEAFLQFVGGQSERQKAMYSDMIATTQRIPPDFEFKRFVHRNSNTLIDPSVPQRSMSNISFPNQDHIATQPLISGFLERKSRAALKGYSTYYYVVTRSKYLHEFKDDDDFKNDPVPELSLYLPDCTVGGISGEKFNVKGKDASKGKIGSTLAMSHELSFKAPTASEAEKWWNIIREAAGEANFTGSVPSSPVESRDPSGQHPPPGYQDSKHPAPMDTQNVPRTGYEGSSITPGGSTRSVPNSTAPASAGAYGSKGSAEPGSAGGYGGPGPAPNSGSAGASPATGAPTSGVDRAPGQY